VRFLAGDGLRRWLREVGGLTATVAPDHEIDRIWDTGTSHDPVLHAAIAERGWIGAGWPKADGGAGRDPADVGLLWEALNYYRLPVDVWELTEMAAWVILQAGTAEQRRSYLPEIRAGRLLFCLGYSEPEAGSDVAAARTTAVREARDWVINGGKIFTTGAHVADYVLLLARTDPSVAKHRGLSMFSVPLSASGVSVFPIHTFGGERTNTVFFDDVRVPSDAVVGDLDNGWSVLNIGLDFERSLMGTYVGRAQRVLDDLVLALEQAGRLGSPDAQRVLAAANVRIESARALADEVYLRIAAGQPISTQAAMTKLMATEVFKDLSFAALELVGVRSLLARPVIDAPVDGRLEHWFRHAQIATIYGGSNEIQRNIISRHHLHLPLA
jgi:alkylation response protein AidB-like acyl-CoA dehydrogenase